ncbi:MAG: outer membrane lipoprotein carrier protein LolA [Xanthomonadaceae bacterium]|nr:outer membrane lipoprotein carrier protein LolA [Xanthomonadaceae bacterium]MDE1885263.1 outer membrane lipoprotein carrier protein LolA [Xanthomonadaceae bacterium]MDE2085486.1 outer membrane lipoprotein carrier protein LolA [Xanthomonadaceae bacterium]MDE2257976.1 outer membrane lipoprotein carrier protein LolA [Xanthomonadaceae bacterium]
MAGLAWSLASLSAAAPPPSAAALIARLKRPVPATTAYTEVRFLHQLTRPLILHGELDYGGADKLRKRVDMPYRETTEISGGRVTMTRAGRASRHFELERAPELKALMDGFSALLGGDAVALQSLYTLSLVDNAANWKLTLTPRDAILAAHLRDFIIDGAKAEPRCFTLRQNNGDASVMLLGTLAATKLPQPTTPAALATVCRAGP